jgi:uncharacterized protein (TIRG00374 family)
MKKHLRTFALAVLILACLYFAFRGISFPDLWESLKQADYVWLIPAMILTLASLILRAFRWHCLLSPAATTRFTDLFSAINICFMANNFLPARSGEFIRAALIGTKYRVSISTVLATVVLERIFDAMCVMSLFIILLFSFRLEERWKKAGLLLVVLYGVLLLCLILGRIYSQGVHRIVHRALSRFSSRVAHKICGVIDSFLQGLNVLRDAKQVLLIVLHSVFVWSSIVLTYYFLCRAFDVRLALQGYLFLVCVLVLAVMAPIPGYVGPFHALFKEALTMFNYPPSLALACAIVAHGSQYIFINLLGIASLRREGVSFSRLKAEEQEAEEELGHARDAGTPRPGDATSEKGADP